jgi:hypothetical protein
MSNTLDPNRIGEVISACADNTERLTDWECQFIEDISDQWDRRQWLSDKQKEILERIYVEKVP